jgi:type II secretory pathway pseudopilin PulG
MTLIEIAVVTVITGIIAAIGTPSLMGILQRDQVKQGLDQIQLALQDAQTNAIRGSKQCTIVINKNSDPPTLDVKNKDLNDPNNHLGCLGSVDRELPNNIAIKIPPTVTNEISFSFKGNISTQPKTIVVQPKKGGNTKRCLVISSGLGIMRSGVYEPPEGYDTESPKADYCRKIIQN